MRPARYSIVKLKSIPSDDFILLSYPGLETNGSVVIAPLLPKDAIAIVETLHPTVETSSGRRVVTVERLAGVSPDLIEPTQESLIAFEYAIDRALSRLFYGN